MFLRSPEIEVWWCGMRSDTRSMQLGGWEFAVEEDYLGGRFTNVIAKHRKAGICLTGRVDTNQLMNSHYSQVSQPVVMDGVQVIATDKHLVYAESPLPSYSRVDMIPSFTDKPARNPFDVFSPWAPDAEEIIVDPPTVAGLLEQIRKLQEPELAEIRKRNRLREYRRGNQREVVQAQILTFA